ncbi:ion channel POLLUX-like 2 [Pyrus ussuriensis x Pyrus communis]|uniref:Ion channel POLLUX-like 2 n=1 Tax=Pyrus ussuriensis x Pyrus communis TaxID=2448454 RepID=A0A5N5GP21_9ROSA|nr:ion channel POLLUX-like 2 [Pyrus ussuriensis x Pyrus communis]
MSNFRHKIEGFKAEFHEWYNMEPPPLPRSPKANPMSSFSFVNSKTPLKNIDQYLNHKLMKAKKKHVDLIGKANKTLYHASKQKTKANISVAAILSHINDLRRETEMEEERNKGFEDFHQIAKGKELHQPQWDSLTVKKV